MHPTAPFARPGAVHAHRTEGIPVSERQEGSNGVGSRIGDGGRIGDGDGVGGGNGDGDGTETGTGKGMEANEGAQDRNGSGDGDGDGDGGVVQRLGGAGMS